MKVNYASLAMIGIVCFVIAVGIWISHPSDMPATAPWFMFGLAVICGVLSYVMFSRTKR